MSFELPPRRPFCFLLGHWCNHCFLSGVLRPSREMKACAECPGWSDPHCFFSYFSHHRWMRERMKKCMYQEISQVLGKNLGSEEGGTFLLLVWSPSILGSCWEGGLGVVKGSGCTGKTLVSGPMWLSLMNSVNWNRIKYQSVNPTSLILVWMKQLEFQVSKVGGESCHEQVEGRREKLNPSASLIGRLVTVVKV